MKRKEWILPALALILVAGSSGRADAPEELLDRYRLSADRLPAGAAVWIREFSTEKTDFGSAEKPGKEKAKEIADVMKEVAPPSFTEAFVKRLAESGVFPQVSAVDGGEVPEGALLVEGEFTVLNPGSRGKRYLVGFGAGRSRICVRVRVVDSSGRELGNFDHCRSGAIGWFGGRAEGMLTTDVYQTAFRLADFLAAWGRGEVDRMSGGEGASSGESPED